VAESARSWTRTHAAELRGSQPVLLPIDDLLPAGTRGQVELRRIESTGGVAVVECRLTIQPARGRLSRRLYWPLVADPVPPQPPAASSRPGPDPATP
jgi:hypothetical protein